MTSLVRESTETGANNDDQALNKANTTERKKAIEQLSTINVPAKSLDHRTKRLLQGLITTSVTSYGYYAIQIHIL